jgi:hypothetical protein
MIPEQIFALLRLIADMYKQTIDLQVENAALRQELEMYRQQASES